MEKRNALRVKLISYTQPSNEFYKETNMSEIKDLVCYMARVSNPSNQMNKETTDKLISYLLKYKHFSPFEMVNVCMEIETTRDIAHQIVRHRSFAFQEFSQRYANPEKQGDMFEYSKARLQDKKNRQNSIDVDDKKLQREWNWAQRRIAVLAKKEYDWAIKKGIAKEQARKVLPEGITKTTLYMNGTLRSWVHYISLRSAHGTQKEHMLIAKKCAKVIAEIFPLINELDSN